MAGTIRTPASGDLRDLYIKYRILRGSHEGTALHFIDKFLAKEVWFEGYMSWTFEKCDFREKFHFGVLGPRFPEDKRGTLEDDRPFPGYGNNVLTFMGCHIREFFEIEDNSTVIFKDCTFYPGVERDETPVLKDNVKAEFIRCYIPIGFQIQSGCEVLFRNCEFEACQGSHVQASDNCSVKIIGGTAGPPVPGSWFTVSGSCDALVKGLGGVVQGQGGPAFLASGASKMSIHGVFGIKGKNPAVGADGASKVQLYNIGQIKNDGGPAILVSGGSELILDTCDLIQASDVCLKVTASTARVTNLNRFEGEGHPCIEGTASARISISNVSEIRCQGKEAAKILASDFDLSNVSTINADFTQAILLQDVGSGESYLRDIGEINNPVGHGILVKNSHRAYLYNVGEIKVENTAIVVETEGTCEDFDGSLREGNVNGVLLKTDGKLRMTRVSEVKGTAVGFLVETGAYDLRSVDLIEGLSGTGALIKSGRGIMNNVTMIKGNDGPGCNIIGASGATEWRGVVEVRSESVEGLMMSGDINNFRISETTKIFSPSKQALLLDITGNALILQDIAEIKSEGSKAFEFIITDGVVKLHRVAKIESTAAEAILGSVQDSGFLYASELADVTSEAATAMKISISGEVKLSKCLKVESEAGNGIELEMLSGGLFQAFDTGDVVGEAAGVKVSGVGYSTALFSGIAKMEGGTGLAMDTAGDCQVKVLHADTIKGDPAIGGLCGSPFVLRDIGNLDSEGSGITFDAVNNPDAHIEISDCGEIKGNVAITNLAGYVRLFKIPSIVAESGDAVSIAGASETGRVEIFDCPEIIAQSGNGVNISGLDQFHIECFATRGSIEANGGNGVNIADSSAQIKHYDTIKGDTSVSCVCTVTRYTLVINDVKTLEGSESGIVTANPYRCEISNIEEIAGGSTLIMAGGSVLIRRCALPAAITFQDVSVEMEFCSIEGEIIAITSSLRLYRTDVETATLLADSEVFAMGGAVEIPIGGGSFMYMVSGIQLRTSSEFINDTAPVVGQNFKNQS